MRVRTGELSPVFPASKIARRLWFLKKFNSIKINLSVPTSRNTLPSPFLQILGKSNLNLIFINEKMLTKIEEKSFLKYFNSYF